MDFSEQLVSVGVEGGCEGEGSGQARARLCTVLCALLRNMCFIGFFKIMD